MMYFKLIFRNVKRSARDYLIYIVTMTICTMLFYAFLSISSRYYRPDIGREFDLSILGSGMQIAICSVTLLILFLIRYVNNYMLLHRQREFAMQSVLGMEQKTIAWLFFAETFVLGAASVFSGILAGMVCGIPSAFLLIRLVSRMTLTTTGVLMPVKLPFGWLLLSFMALLFLFGGFIIGKLVDSLIIGIICFFCMSLMKMPYVLLISVIIGITNIIPFFGPFIGAVPSAVLVLLVNPLQCIYFLIFILLLQQFDGNILGPKILGESTGLSSFWVLFSILLFGGVFGFVGMIIGVPAFAVIYRLLSDGVKASLRKRRLPVETSAYEGANHVDEANLEIRWEDAEGAKGAKDNKRRRPQVSSAKERGKTDKDKQDKAE